MQPKETMLYLLTVLLFVAFGVLTTLRLEALAYHAHEAIRLATHAEATVVAAQAAASLAPPCRFQAQDDGQPAGAVTPASRRGRMHFVTPADPSTIAP